MDILALGAALVAGYGLVAARLDRFSIGPALAFTTFGLLLGTAGLGVIDFPIESDIAVGLSEITLAVVLFSDASTVDGSGLRRDASIIGRLLGVGLPLTIIFGALGALILFPGLPIAVALLVATILAPTDAALAAPIVSNSALPLRVRRILNIESGLNDGIASPFIVLFTVLATAGANESHWVAEAVSESALAIAVGVGVGALGAGGLVIADRRSWASAASRQLTFGALALAAFAVSSAIGGNGFIAAFVGGLAFRATARGRLDDVSALAEGVGTVLSIVIWLLFGALLAGSAVEYGLDLAAVLFAILSLTVVRMAPVALALVGSGLRWPTIAFIGWFGPRGLASIAFGLTAIENLSKTGIDTQVVIQMIAWTVLLSVVLHGASARSLGARYASSAAAAGEGGDVTDAREPRSARRGDWAIRPGAE